jgi:hypothetical protein
LLGHSTATGVPRQAGPHSATYSVVVGTGFNGSGVKVSGLLYKPRLLGQDAVGIGAQRCNGERLAGQRDRGAGRCALPGVVDNVLRFLDRVAATATRGCRQEAFIACRSGTASAAVGFREESSLGFPRGILETGIVVRISSIVSCLELACASTSW